MRYVFSLIDTNGRRKTHFRAKSDYLFHGLFQTIPHVSQHVGLLVEVPDKQTGRLLPLLLVLC